MIELLLHFVKKIKKGFSCSNNIRYRPFMWNLLAMFLKVINWTFSSIHLFFCHWYIFSAFWPLLIFRYMRSDQKVLKIYHKYLRRQASLHIFPLHENFLNVPAILHLGKIYIQTSFTHTHTHTHTHIYIYICMCI